MPDMYEGNIFFTQDQLALAIAIFGDEVELLLLSDKSAVDAVLIKKTDFATGNLENVYALLGKKIFVSKASLTNPYAKITDEFLSLILREEAKLYADRYYKTAHHQKTVFQPGDRIAYAARVFDSREIAALIDSSLDFWLTEGKYAAEFEKKLCEFLNTKYCSLVNSGSSANLLAFMALTSYKLGEKRIRPGDEIITVAASFPTTVAPLIQYGAIPVFVDVSIPQYNVDVSMLRQALSVKTKAVMVAHTLGNPFDLETIKDFCDENGLWFIEDNCDALGSQYYLKNEWKFTGTIGDIGTSSFYPPHHITTGEGGAVYTNNEQLFQIVNSLRDWGRDCWCKSGHDDTCGNRFNRQFGELPPGYDHKYVYSHLGYNLKMTDLQASIGVAQMEKLPDFIKKRNANWDAFKDKIRQYDDYFILPEKQENSIPCWFGFLLTLKNNRGFSRNEITGYLENKNIQTRNLFAGNILKHPCFDEMREKKTGYRVVGSLKNTDKIMEDSFWLGVYPKITTEMIDYIVNCVGEFIHIKGKR